MAILRGQFKVFFVSSNCKLADTVIRVCHENRVPVRVVVEHQDRPVERVAALTQLVAPLVDSINIYWFSVAEVVVELFRRC